MNIKNAITISKKLNEYFRIKSWKDGVFMRFERFGNSYNLYKVYSDKGEYGFYTQIVCDFSMTDVLGDWEIVKNPKELIIKTMIPIVTNIQTKK